jgi:RecB family endonuclease NucS
MQRRVVEMLPGCGMVAARDLLRHFGSVRRIANAGRDELRAVRGIGAAKAARMHQVLNADYESVDTEKDMEDAVQAEPGLLFRRPGTLLARQHYVYTEEGERQFVDLVFVNAKADRIALVELKRGKLTREHAAQLRRYLDHARESPLLRSLLDKGARARGVLATLEPCQFDPKDPDISVRVVRKERVIRVLKQLRDQRRAAEVEVPRPAAAEEGGT